MNTNSSSLIKNSIYIVLVLLIGFLFTILFITFKGLDNAKVSSQIFEAYNLNDNKEKIRNEVLNRIDEINYESKAIHNNEKTLIRNKINQIEWLLNRSAASEIVDFNKRQTAILEEYEQLYSIDSNNHYFAFTTDGTMMKSNTKNYSEGSMMYNAMDSHGNYYIQDMLEAISHPDGIYINYYLTRHPGDTPTLHIAYCKYLEAYNLVISTGFYEEDIQAELRKRTFDKLQSYYDNQENYIFVTSYDAIALVTSNKAYVGTNFSNFKTVEGNSLHELFIKKANSPNDHFINYSYYKKGSLEEIEKISYVMALDNWDAYIGMGFYINDLEPEINAFSSTFAKQHKTLVMYVILSLILIALCVLFLVKRGNTLQRQYIKQEEIVFNQLLQLSDEAIIIISKKGTLKYYNAYATKLFGTRIEKYITNGVMNLTYVEQSTYTLEHISGQIIYIDLKKEYMDYHREPADIYFMNNVTDTYLKANTYEQLALKDELTGAPNRRALQNDFNKMVFDYSSQKSTVLVMIDIDHFKAVNDNFGHNIGDEVIKCLYITFKSRIRQTDCFYRYGGEEFVILLKNISLATSLTLLTEINQQFSNTVKQSYQCETSFSGGVTEVDWSENTSLNHYLKEADILLYQAKEKGRNRVEYKKE